MVGEPRKHLLSHLDAALLLAVQFTRWQLRARPLGEQLSHTCSFTDLFKVIICLLKVC
jgi:hypothetical protein